MVKSVNYMKTFPYNSSITLVKVKKPQSTDKVFTGEELGSRTRNIRAVSRTRPEDCYIRSISSVYNNRTFYDTNVERIDSIPYLETTNGLL